MPNSNYSHLPYAQLSTPEVSSEWMRYFRQCVESELTRNSVNINTVQENVTPIIEEFDDVPTPAVASYYSITSTEGTIYVQLNCAESVTGYELSVTTVSGTRKIIYYAESNATTGRGYFEFTALEPVYLWARTVNKGTWAEARSEWTQYSAAMGSQFTNVLTDTITGKGGYVPNFTHITVYRDLYYNADAIMSYYSGGGYEDNAVGYFEKSVISMGAHGVRIRFQNHGPLTTSYPSYQGFLVMVPDAAMTGDSADWLDKTCYFMGIKHTGAGFYALIAKFTGWTNSGVIVTPDYYDPFFTQVAISAGPINPTYLDANGNGALELRVENNTFYIKGGASYATTLVTATDTSYLFGSTRNGVGVFKFSDGNFQDDVSLTIDQVNFITGSGTDSIDPGLLPIDRGGCNNSAYTNNEFLIYSSTNGRVESSGYDATDFAPNPHNVLSTYHGDTLAAAVAQGSLIYGNATPKWAALAGDNTGTRKYLSCLSNAVTWEPMTITHEMLSATHTDSTAASVVRGDIIIGSGATPKWVRYAKGAQGTIFNAGADEPQWGTTLTTVDATTNVVTDLYTIDHQTSGTAAAGFGSGLLFNLESNTTASQNAAQLAVSWTTATHATRTSKVEIFNVINGTSTGYLHQPYNTTNLFLGYSAGNRTLTGTNNIGIGYQSGLTTSSGANNVSIGYNSLANNSTGCSNVAIGPLALSYSDTHTGNIAIGDSALKNNHGDGNVVIGINCLANATAAGYITAIGYAALQNYLSGGYNTAVGYYASQQMTTAGYCTSIGYSSLSTDVSGEHNTAVGYQSLYSATAGRNTAVGSQALRSVAGGQGNTAVGYIAGYPAGGYGYPVTSGSWNVFIGDNCGFADNTQRDFAIAIGATATVGASNACAIGGTGAYAVDLIVGGTVPSARAHFIKESADTNAVRNIEILTHNSTGTPAAGFGAGILGQLESSTTASQDAAQIAWSWTDATHATRTSKVEIFDVINGTLTGFIHTPASNTNMFVGHQSGNRTLTGTGNVGIGYQTCLSLSNGSNNFCAGASAGYQINSGSNNFMMGYHTGLSLLSGSYNVAIGGEALVTVSTTSRNTAIGYVALNKCSGSYNTAIGSYCLNNIVGVDDNTGIGDSVMSGVTGARNTAVGKLAGYSSTSNNNSVFLGYCAGRYETGSNSVIIDSLDRSTEAAGRINSLIYGITNAAPASQYLTVNGNLYSQMYSADTNSVRNIVTVRHDSTGTPAAGLGGAILGQLHSTTTVDQDAAQIAWSWTDATHATRTSKLTFGTVNSAAALANYLHIIGNVVRAGDGATNYAQFAADGELNLVGTARVYKEVRIESTRAKKGSAAPAESERAVGASGGVILPVLSFSKTTQQDCYFTVETPSDMDTSSPAVFHLMWQPGAAWTTGNYLWKLEYLVLNETGATLLAGTPTTISADVTPSNATTNIETVFVGNITLAADQYIVCHFYRDVADTADDIGEVSYFELRYLVNKLGVAS